MQDLVSGAPGEDKIKLLLSVVRAYDVPVRCDSDPLSHNQPLQSQSNLQSAIGGGMAPNEANVHTYVEARFQVGATTF